MTKPKPPFDPVATVQALARIMETHGLSELKCTPAGEIVMVRNPFAAAMKDEKKGPTTEDDFDRLKRMSPAEQDRALALGGLGPMGSG